MPGSPAGEFVRFHRPDGGNKTPGGCSVHAVSFVIACDPDRVSNRPGADVAGAHRRSLRTISAPVGRRDAELQPLGRARKLSGNFAGPEEQWSVECFEDVGGVERRFVARRVLCECFFL